MTICVCARLRACVRACMRVYVRACVCALDYLLFCHFVGLHLYRFTVNRTLSCNLTVSYVWDCNILVLDKVFLLLWRFNVFYCCVIFSLFRLHHLVKKPFNLALPQNCCLKQSFLKHTYCIIVVISLSFVVEYFSHKIKCTSL